jgi:hypothetical protein
MLKKRDREVQARASCPTKHNATLLGEPLERHLLEFFIAQAGIELRCCAPFVLGAIVRPGWVEQDHIEGALWQIAEVLHGKAKPTLELAIEPAIFLFRLCRLNTFQAV